MRTGTARTSYDWGRAPGEWASGRRPFVSRAAPSLAVARLDLDAGVTGRVGVRFALAGGRRPERLALGTLRRADPSWGPATSGIPATWSFAHARHPRRTVPALTMTSLPEGRSTLLAQALALSLAADAPESARSDTAALGRRHRAGGARPSTPRQGRTLQLHPGRERHRSAEEAHPVTRAATRPRPAWSAGSDSLAEANARGMGPALGDATSRSTATRRCSGSSLHAVLPPLQRRLRHRLGIPPMGLSSAGYYGHIFWDSDTWMFPSLLLTHPDIAHSLVAFRARLCRPPRPTRRPTASAARCIPGRPTSTATRPRPLRGAERALRDPRQRRRRPGPVAVLSGHRRLGLARARRLPGDPGDRRLLGQPRDLRLDRRRYHIRNVVSVSEGLIGVSDDAYTNAVARKNLEIAAAASRRLGDPADPQLERGRGQAAPAVRLGQPVLPHLRGRARLHPGRRHSAPELSARRCR